MSKQQKLVIIKKLREFFGTIPKENPLKRKRDAVPHEDPDLQPEERPSKRRRTEETEAKNEASCSLGSKERKVSSVERQMAESLHEEPEPKTKRVPAEGRRTKAETTKSRARFFQNTKFQARYTTGKLLGSGGFGAVYEGVRRSDKMKMPLEPPGTVKAVEHVLVVSQTQESAATVDTGSLKSDS